MPDRDATRRPFLSALLVSVLFGVAAGAVGTLLVLAYVAPSATLTSAPAVTRAAGGPRTPAEAVLPPSLDSAVRSLAFIAPAKTSADPVQGSYVPGDAVGIAMVLTSDGWLVTDADALQAKGKKPTDFAVVSAGKAYPVRDLVRDPYSGAAFVKVDATDLSVTAFGSSDSLSPGDAAYGFDAAGGVRTLSVVAFETAPERTSDDLLLSSERMQRVIRVTGGPLLMGSVVVDRKGEAVGLYLGEGPFGGVVAPVEAYKGVIGTVLRGNPPSRPFLGLRYVDLSRLADTVRTLPARGALLTASADGKTPAVVRKGPADVAGLKAGDIIVAVDGVQVTGKNPLSDLLADYAPGDVVSFTVTRAGVSAEATVGVTLGASPSP